MIKLAFVGTCAIALVCTSAMAQSTSKRERATTGQAGGYSYCLRTAAGPGDCKYRNLEQCQAAQAGTLGTCVRNTGPR